MSSTGGSRNEISSRRIPPIKYVYVRKGRKVAVPKEMEKVGPSGCQPQKEEIQQQPENQHHSSMSSTGGSTNKLSSRRIPPIKYVYVRRGRKATVPKEMKKVGHNVCQPHKENQQQAQNQQHSREKGSQLDGSMFSDASVAPYLATLSNTQLLRHVEFMAAANRRLQENDGAPADETCASAE